MIHKQAVVIEDNDLTETYDTKKREQTYDVVETKDKTENRKGVEISTTVLTELRLR